MNGWLEVTSNRKDKHPEYRFYVYDSSRKVMERVSILSALIISLIVLVSGCITKESDLEQKSTLSEPCPDDQPPEWFIGCSMPSFSLLDDSNISHNESSTNGSGRWVAYFSATWCGHCKPTIMALNEGIASGHMLVFNKDARDEYSNMSAWKELMENETNQTFNRPFIHAPGLAENLTVSSIPHIVLIDNNTIISVRRGLWDDSESITTWFHSESPASGLSQQIENP